MTPKQQLRSIEKKMQRIQESMPFIDLKVTTRHIKEVNRYSELSKEHFMLKFELEHCQTCGKKIEQ